MLLSFANGDQRWQFQCIKSVHASKNNSNDIQWTVFKLLTLILKVWRSKYFVDSLDLVHIRNIVSFTVRFHWNWEHLSRRVLWPFSFSSRQYDISLSSSLNSLPTHRSALQFMPYFILDLYERCTVQILKTIGFKMYWKEKFQRKDIFNSKRCRGLYVIYPDSRF